MRLAITLAVLFPVTLAAQAPAGDSTSSAVITAIDLVRQDVFDSAEARGNWAFRTANKLHATTRPWVVRRELLFTPGQVYDSARFAETARNLRALGIFRRVLIDTVRTDSGLVARVTTKDGWSTKTDFRFRSVGGQIIFTFGVLESNLGGTLTEASVWYRNDPDRTAVTLGFRRPRLVANAVGVAAAYEDRSDGQIFRALVNKPFFSLSTRAGWLADFDDRDTRVLRFYDGNPVARDTLQRRFVIGRAEGALAVEASPRGYWRLGAQAQVRREDFRPYRQVDSFPPPRTVTAAFGPYLEWRRARFVVARGFQGFAREEDVDVSSTIRVGVLAAPAVLGYERSGFAPHLSAQVGTNWPRGFVYGNLLAHGLFSGTALDSGAVRLSGTAVWLEGWRQMAVIHGEAGWLRNPAPGAEFDYGGGVGPRAFRLHAFTGDRSVYSTVEYRYTLAEDLWKFVGVGVAGFADYGGAWYHGQPRRTGWDAGFGLRLGPSRTPEVEPVRVDLAYRFAMPDEPGGWVLVIGKGLPFSIQTGRTTW